MKKIFLITFGLLPLFFAAHSQNHISFSNFLSYSSIWQFGGYSNSNNAKWKDIYFIKGDTLVANEWYYKVFQQNQSYDLNSNLKSTKTTFAYLLRESKDSALITLNTQGIFTISHKTSDLSSNYTYKTEYLKAQIPFVSYYEDQKFGAACGFMQGIGHNPCPPNQQGATYFECYQKNGKTTDKDGNSCNIKLITTADKSTFFKRKFEIFPNPTNGFLQIKSDSYSKILVEIIEVTGNLLKSETILNDSKIDISDFQQGVYFIKITQKGESYFLKIIKI